MKKIIFLFPLLMISCSTAKVRVMPGENGINKVISKDIEKDDSEEEAVDAANEYCEKQGKSAVFLKEGSKYTGKMDEDTRDTIRTASKVGMIVGGVGVGAGRGASTPGAVLGTASAVGYGVTSNRDYTAEVEFKCQ